jgi:undecaprenyl-phosphate 4-deoxy-4-formamido-L-arabinose transferase
MPASAAGDTEGRSPLMAPPACELSVVVPCYNESANIAPLFERLIPALGGASSDYEVICVNDGSLDNTLALLREQQARLANVTVVDFTRNFGQHNAIAAGFDQCRGRYIVTIDADLQNPPEEIAKLVEAMRPGGGDHDVVGTIRTQRKDSLMRRLMTWSVTRTTGWMTGIRLKDYGSMLRGYHRAIVQTMSRSQEVSTFIPALAASYARNLVEIPVKHESRHAGQTNYPLRKLVSLQFDLMTSFSTALMRVMVYTGLLVAVCSFGLAAYLLGLRFYYGPDADDTHGVFTLIALLFLVVGVLTFFVGVLGEYIGRIYLEVRDRPRFIVRSVFRESAPPASADNAPAP